MTVLPTKQELETWECKLRYEVDEAIREARNRIRETGERTGYIRVQWTEEAFHDRPSA